MRYPREACRPMVMERIGPHRLHCGDVTKGAVATLMGTERADVVYSDMPWGPGNTKYWATMLGRASTSTPLPTATWPELLGAFCRACASARTHEAPVFVEMGLRWEHDLVEAMAMVGLPRQARWTTFYGSRRAPTENLLSLFGPLRIAIELTSPHGEPMTRQVLSAVVRPDMIVLDPCTGLGMTARGTHHLGGRFRGNELNPVRLERTAAWLRKQVRP